MNSNSAFTIGKTHDICQDYAVAGVRANGEPYVIVADGCSSSPDTDIGARLLVKAAERLLCSSDCMAKDGMQEWHERAARLAMTQAKRMELNPRCVDATLLTIHVCGDQFIAACYGDGVIALQRRDGTMEVHSISFAESYPRYPGYAHQRERRMLFEARSDNIKEVIRCRLNRGDSDWHTAEKTISRNLAETFSGKVADYEFIAVMTDGLHSFAETVRGETIKRVEAVAPGRVIRELLAFKNTSGAFVQRRLNKFLSDGQKRNWQHHDDLAVGAVCF